MKSKFLLLTTLLSTLLFAQDISNSALKWRFIGPMIGSRGSVVLGHPTNSHEFYFGASNGLWKTEDAGQHWKNISDGYFQT